MPTIINVDVNLLDFDLQNPRNDAQESQRQALETMLLSEPKKSATLAEHIVSNGRNPLDLIAVIKSGTNRYTVLEGNRRAAVLKVLNKPILIESLPDGAASHPSIRKIKQLAGEADVTTLKETEAVLFDSREEANVWIGLKHTGENNGAGTVVWDGIQSARFRKGDAGFALLVYGKAKAWFTDESLNKRAAFPISTLNRLIGDPYVRQALGLEYAGGRIEATVSPEQLARGIKRVVSDLADGKITVTKLKLKADRATYIDALPSRDRPDLSKQVEAWTLDANAAKAQAATTSKARSRAASTTRQSLIPGRFIVTTNIKSPRLNNIYRELKRLHVDTYPNSVAVLLRAFIELSLDDFIRREGVKVTMNRPPQATLAEKVNATVEHLKTSNRLSKSAAQPILKLASNAPSDRARPASITTLHAFVHSLHAAPLPSELKDIWDTIEPFMKEVVHIP